MAQVLQFKYYCECGLNVFENVWFLENILTSKFYDLCEEDLILVIAMKDTKL